MRRLLSHRSTQSLMVAVIAVVLALGGTALATNGGGSSRDASAVAAKKKKPKRPSRTIRRYVARYVKHHPGPRGRKGTTGQQGAQGAPGTPGTPGTPGAAGRDGVGVEGYVFGDLVHLDPDDASFADATCPSGFIVTGGGYWIGDFPQGVFNGDDPAIWVGESDGTPLDTPGVHDDWEVLARNTGNGQGGNADAGVIAFAACAPGEDVTPPQVRHAKQVFAHSKPPARRR